MPPSLKTTGAGFDSPDVSGEEPQSATLRLFCCLCMPFMGGAGGEPQGSPVLTRSVNPFVAAHPFDSGEAVRETNWSQHIMANTTTPAPDAPQNPYTMEMYPDDTFVPVIAGRSARPTAQKCYWT